MEKGKEVITLIRCSALKNAIPYKGHELRIGEAIIVSIYDKNDIHESALKSWMENGFRRDRYLRLTLRIVDIVHDCCDPTGPLVSPSSIEIFTEIVE